MPGQPLTLDPLTVAAEWHADGRGVAIATVIETWSSAPRPAGSHLVIDSAGNFHGSVSGGCVEEALIPEALEVIASGIGRTVEFGVTDDAARKAGLFCGGRIRLYIEKLG
ncbi:XdhC family protein [Pararhizobium sp.]|uniref:XdhC family protein n=1 Tax=Pararhizobium sp. TaxID=1977563 RepID=UPI003D0BD032